MTAKPESTTPADFPRDYGLSSVSGVQPKLAVRKIGDGYVSGLTGEELYVRYDVCFDLVNQLEVYCNRKLKEHPDWSGAELCDKVSVSLAARTDWDFSKGEIRWMLTQLCSRMEWQPLAGT
jgi:hypothetical protein